MLVLVLAVLTVSYASSLRAYLQQRAHIGGFPLPVDLAEPTGTRVAVVGSGPFRLVLAE